MSTRSTSQGRAVSRQRVRIASVAAVLVAAAGCGGSTTTPTVTALHGEVSDGAGDALADPSVPVSPDLVRGTIDVSGGNLAVTIRFAPGTSDRSTSRVTIDDDRYHAGYRSGSGARALSTRERRRQARACAAF